MSAKGKAKEGRARSRRGAASAKKEEAKALRCFPFGGVGEFGKNMMVYAWGRDAVIVDCGATLPEASHHGVDAVAPDISALKEMNLRLHAILLTHGHDDHVGGLPFIWPELRLPIYGLEATLAVVRKKMEHFGHRPQLKQFPKLGRRTRIGPFLVEALPVTHSIMDAASLAIKTPLGIVVHTGDFRFDPTPIDGRATPLHRLAQWGDEGVLLLASDSTNATRQGAAPSERIVGPTLRQVIAGAQGRVFVTTFASNMYRVQQIVDAAHACGRKVAIAGTSLEQTFAAMRDLGRVHVPPGALISLKEATELPREQTLIIATGCQGETRAAMAAIAQGRHPLIKIQSGDLVVFSSSVIPGNERAVARLFDHIYRRGGRVVHAGQVPSLHVSGHAYAHELKMMIQLTRPRYFMPVHGEYRYLVEHRELAVAAGVPFERTVIAENGQSVVVDAQGIRLGDRFRTGALLVDAESLDEIDEVMLRDRRKIAQEGLVTAIVVIAAGEGTLLGPPQLVARGALQAHVQEELLRACAEDLAQHVEQMDRETLLDREAAQEEVRLFVRRWFRKRIGRRPMVLPVVMEV